jgi:hypothetical protein
MQLAYYAAVAIAMPSTTQAVSDSNTVAALTLALAQLPQLIVAVNFKKMHLPHQQCHQLHSVCKDMTASPSPVCMDTLAARPKPTSREHMSRLHMYTSQWSACVARLYAAPITLLVRML